MARHQMPQRTKRRLIAAGIAAVTIIGTGVVIGVTGAASARNRANPVDLSVLECIPVEAQPSAPPSQPPAPASSSSAAADAAPPADAPADGNAPPAEEAPPAEAPAEQPPAEAPAEQPADQAPAEAPATNGFARPKPPAQPGAQPADNGAAAADNGAAAQANNAAVTPPSETPGKPAAPPAANAPDEMGPQPANTPEPQPQAEDVKQFTKPSCTDVFGPFPQDFVNIAKVKPANLNPRVQSTGSRGTFTTRCGKNENGHRNSDNHIAAPNVVNGAHHIHDYVGNLDTSNKSTPESLAAAGTTCNNGDKSAYFWPVLRVRNKDGGGAAADAPNPHNIGELIAPATVTLQFRGNATSKVVAMPQFIKILTGNAKATIQAGANANAKWSCTGFTNRFTDKYPLCPRGSRVLRQADFPSCWDGVNTDSANHRTHVLFADKNGACPAGTKAIPALRITTTYNIPPGRIFAVDAFPEVQHSPTTDHNDFENVMPVALMNRAVACINSGRNC